jgi:hypothetical protein
MLMVAGLLLLALVWLLVGGLARLTTWIAGSELSVASRGWIMVIIYGVMLCLIAFLWLVSFGESVPSGRNKSSAFHRAIMAGLEDYHSEFGEYPAPVAPGVIARFDGHDYDVSGALMLYQALTGDGDDRIKTALPDKRASDGRIDEDELKRAFLRDMPQEMIRKTETGYLLVDGFGHPYQFSPSGSASVNDTFDLWSFAESTPTLPIEKPVKQSPLAAHWIKNW